MPETHARAKHELIAFMQHAEDYEVTNPIHTAAGGQEYGFKNALVPGITVYGWTVPALTEVLGDSWIDTGWADFALRRPTYPGDRLVIVVEQQDEQCSFSVTSEEGEVRLIGTAGNGAAPWLGELTRPTRLVAESAEDSKPRLRLEDAPIQKDIRPLAIEVTEDAARAIARDRFASADPRFIGERPRIHPAAYTNLTKLIKHSYDFAPSIHTGTRVQYLQPAYAGQTITLAARCVEAFEKREHQYITVDGVMLSEDQAELARIRHTVIFSVAKRAAT